MHTERETAERNPTEPCPQLSPELGPVLAIDSCGAETTLALARYEDGGTVSLKEATLGAKTAGSLLTGALRDLLDGLAPSALAAIVVVRGPGSFTGMRIGLSAAKALSEAAAVPLVGVSRLAVLAAQSGTRFAALDAGRGNVYLRSPGHAVDVDEEAMLTPDELRARLPEPGQLAVCEDKVHALFPQARRVPAPTAAQAVEQARAWVLAGDWDDAATLDALYLWRPEQMLGKPG